MLERPWEQQYQQTSYRTSEPSKPTSRHHKSSSSHSYRHRRRPARTIKSLPDEILAQVFSEVAKNDVVYDRKGRAFAISGRKSLLNTALVCRKFQWIVTPLLYERLEICPDNEAVIRETLLQDPTLTKHIHHLRIDMPRRFRTWSMKYHFSPTTFSLTSKYGIDLEILDHFMIDRHSLRELYIGNAMNVDLRMYQYIAQMFPRLEKLTVESPVSFHSQWGNASLEDTIKTLLPLRKLTHLHLNSNFNPSRTANRPATRTWADLERLLPRLPERLQALTFGSLARGEQFISLRQSLVRCSASKAERPDPKGHRRRSSMKQGYDSGKSTKWWKVEVPHCLRERINMLAKWGSPMRLDEVFLYI